MFNKNKAKDKVETPSAAKVNNSSLSMEFSTDLKSIFGGGVAYDINIEPSFKPKNFEEDSETMEKVVAIIVDAKKLIAQTYKKNGEGYRQMFLGVESALANLRRLVASGAIGGKAILALSTDINQLDRALNTIRIFDKGTRITRANFQRP